MNIDFEITKILGAIRKTHLEDPILAKYMQDLVDILSTNENETIEYLMGVDDFKIIDEICIAFPEVSMNLQSKKFIDCIVYLYEKSQDYDLGQMLEDAKLAMIDDVE